MEENSITPLFLIGISEVKALIPALNINTTLDESRNDFLIRHLNACALGTNTKGTGEKAGSNLILYPNPTSSYFSIRLAEGRMEKVAVYTVNGKRMYVEQPASSVSMKISTDSWPAGIYLVLVKKVDGTVLSKRIVVE